MQGTREGATYDLTFAIGSARKYPPAKPAPPKPAQIGIFVEVVGVPKAAMPFDAPTTQDVSHWEQRTLRFTAASGTTTIAFSGCGNPGANTPDCGDFVDLDAVLLRRVCSLIQLVWDCE